MKGTEPVWVGGWGGTCSNSQRAPEEMKTSILTRLRIPFTSSLVHSRLLLQLLQQAAPLRPDPETNPSPRSGGTFKSEMSAFFCGKTHGMQTVFQKWVTAVCPGTAPPRRRREGRRTNGSCHRRHTLTAQVVANAEAGDVCAGQAGRDPKLLYDSSEKAPAWAPAVKMRMKWGKKGKTASFKVGPSILTWQEFPNNTKGAGITPNYGAIVGRLCIVIQEARSHFK